MLPSLFISHGSPMLPLTPSPARDFLAGLGLSMKRPKAILVASAHWETKQPEVNAVEHNHTIHDFFGFPRALYELKYPAPGNPVLAERVADLIRAAGLPSTLDRTHGLDHGAWVPLLLAYPKAVIPVLQVSIQKRYSRYFSIQTRTATGYSTISHPVFELKISSPGSRLIYSTKTTALLKILLANSRFRCLLTLLRCRFIKYCERRAAAAKIL